MKWIGKHPVFSDLLIGGVLLSSPDNQYSYELTLPNDDGTAGQVLTTDGNGVLTWTTNSAGGTGVSMTNGVDNRIMTATGAQDITGEANLTYNSSTSMMVLSSASAANLPAFILINDHAGTDGGTIGFQKIQDGSDNDEVGQLTWQSDDDAGGAFNVGHITGYVADASNNDEAGKIELKVMTDGTGTQQGLTATGSGTVEQVDVSIAHASTSTTTIAGGISANSGGLTYTPAVNTLQISTNSAGNLPTIAISNDHTGGDAGILYFKKLQDGSDNDELGIISWFGDDDGGNQLQFASITGRIADASDTDEGGKLELKVLTNSSEYQQALIATGSGTASNVDVGIAHGASSTTAIAGELTLGVDLAITHGGTGQSTAQAAIDALSQVSGASAGEALIKDGSGNATWAAQTNTTYTAGDGLDLSGTEFSADLKSNGGLVIESTELAVDLGASSITGTLAVGDGGTGLTTVATDNILTGNGTGALTSESTLTYSGSTNRFSAGGTSSSWQLGGIYSSGFPSVLTSAIGANAVIDGYSLFGTSVSSMIKFNSGGSFDQAANYIEAAHAAGTNKSGADLILVGGSSTGSDIGGSFKFFGGASGGGSGTTQRLPTQKFEIDGDGNTTMSGDLILSGADKGVIFEGTTADAHETTLKGGEPTADRTITLPDATGTVALTTDIPDETVSTGSFISKQVKVTLSQSDCNSLNTTPVELIPAQGANTIIVPAGGILMVDRGGAQNNSAADLNFHYADKEPGTYAQTSLFHIRRFMYGNLTDIIYSTGELSGIEISQNLTDPVNKAVEVSVDSALTTNSMTSITIYLTYHVIDIS